MLILAIFAALPEVATARPALEPVVYTIKFRTPEILER
jgi:hypothetical protein